MTPKQMEARYKKLRKSWEAGEITKMMFSDSVAQLRLEDAEGTEYRIDFETGRWMRKEGRSWVPSKRPSARSARLASKFHLPKFREKRKSGKEKRPEKTKEPRAVTTAGIPEGLGPLLKLIMRQTMINFKRRLPITILIGLGTYAAFTFIMVVLNNGYAKTTIPGAGLLGMGSNGAIVGLSGAAIFMVLSGLLIGTVTSAFRKGPGGAVVDFMRTPRVVFDYFSQAGELAFAALAAGAGISMVIGSVLNGYANLAVALGVGTLLVSRAGRVLSLLVRSAWGSTYALVQGERTRQFGMAAGHVALMGSALGFTMNSVLAPMGFAFGVVLLAAALFLARRGEQTPTISVIWPLIAYLMVELLYAARSFAHDGGLAECGSSFSRWVTCKGAATAMVVGLGPAAGAMVGPAFVQSLVDVANTLDVGDIEPTDEMEPGEPEEPEGLVPYDEDHYDRLDTLMDEVRDPRIFDEVMRISDRAGETGYIDEEDLARIEALQEDYRQSELERIRKEHEAQSDQWFEDIQEKHVDELEKMKKDQELVDDYYRRGDYLRDKMGELAPEQQKAVERILGKIGWQETGITPGDIDPDDLEDLKRLTKATADIRAGASEAEAAAAESDAATAQLGEEVSKGMATVGRMSAARLEGTFSPMTGGAVTGFVFGAAENWDKGAGGMMKNGLISAGTSAVDTTLGRARPGDVTWNVSTGMLSGAAEQALKGGDIDDMKRGAAAGGLGGFVGALGDKEMVQRGDEALRRGLGLPEDIEGTLRGGLGRLGGTKPDVDAPSVPRGPAPDAPEAPPVRPDAPEAPPVRGEAPEAPPVRPDAPDAPPVRPDTEEPVTPFTRRPDTDPDAPPTRPPDTEEPEPVGTMQKDPPGEPPKRPPADPEGEAPTPPKRPAPDEEAPPPPKKPKPDEEETVPTKAEEEEAEVKPDEDEPEPKPDEEEPEPKPDAEEEEEVKVEIPEPKPEDPIPEPEPALLARVNQEADDHDHLSTLPGMMGEHAQYDLGNDQFSGDIPNRPYTTNSGKTITDPHEASIARHVEAKGDQTEDPWTSYAPTYEKATKFNRRGEIAQVDMTESDLRAMINNKTADRVDYGKMGNTDYIGEQELVVQSVPKENWKLTNGRPADDDAGILREYTRRDDKLSGFQYYEKDGQKIFRLYRGLSRHDIR